MNNDKLLAAIDDIASEISGEFFTPRHIIWQIVSDAILPLFTAPAPVDDKALAEAIKYTQCLSAQGGCEPAPWGPHKQLQLETVLTALRAAQQEAAGLREKVTGLQGLDILNDSIISDQREQNAKILAKQDDAHKLTREVAQLQEWKRQCLEVWNSWDVQAVGKLLGVPLGKAIHPEIAPGIEALRRELEDMRADRDTWEVEAEVLTRQVADLRKDKERLLKVIESLCQMAVVITKHKDVAQHGGYLRELALGLDYCVTQARTHIAEVKDQKARAAGEGKGAT